MSERKWMYVLRGSGESHEAWSDRMQKLARELLELGPGRPARSLEVVLETKAQARAKKKAADRKKKQGKKAQKDRKK